MPLSKHFSGVPHTAVARMLNERSLKAFALNLYQGTAMAPFQQLPVIFHSDSHFPAISTAKIYNLNKRERTKKMLED